MASIEEAVEKTYDVRLQALGVRRYYKTESVNSWIDAALSEGISKGGGFGGNYPDIKLFLEHGGRTIPVMVEAKGSAGKLLKLDGDTIAGPSVYKSGKNKGKINYANVQQYAVNGAFHYGKLLLEADECSEVIIVGINGSTLDEGVVIDFEQSAWYLSKANAGYPKEIADFDEVLFAPQNLEKFFGICDDLKLSDAEREALKTEKEIELEMHVKRIHQALYDDDRVRNILGANEKLYLFTGLIMAGLTKGTSTKPVSLEKLDGQDSPDDNDGVILLSRIKSFLRDKGCTDAKIKQVMGYLNPVFGKDSLWRPKRGESTLRVLYKDVKENIVPLLENELHLDFTGRILNSLNDWVHIENDAQNDVVLTPRYITKFMAEMCRTNMNSYVWDRAMGSGGFLVAAMDIMIRDAQENIKDKDALEAKIRYIKEQQLLGVEILGNIYILAVLNMILMGDGSSNIYCEDSHNFEKVHGQGAFDANVFLLNPPYSADGKGFVFVEETLKQMQQGYAAILIQENAGSGNGLPYTKRILENNTLVASIHMPGDIFGGKASVQAGIYVFKVNEPHDVRHEVLFIDMSDDGYTRQNRKKSSQEVNLRDTDHASERYAEVRDLVLGRKPETSYYTENNGLFIRDVISLEGDDWTFAQHRKIDTVPTLDDFKKTVADYLSWRVGQVIQDA